MSAWQQRRVCFAGTAVEIVFCGERAENIVEFLFQHSASTCDADTVTTYRLFTGVASHLTAFPSNDCQITDSNVLACSTPLALYQDDTLIYTGPSDALLADHLLGGVCHDLAEHSQGGLLFHAAALGLQGRGLLLPGRVGAGKTTLTAWLLSKGWQYLTDEMVFIATGERVMQTFTRPLNLKSSARSALVSYFEFEHNSQHILSTPQADLIPHTLFSACVISELPSVDVIVFPTYESQSDFVLHPLSKAQGAAMLMASLVNARNLPEMGFSEVVRLARCVSACEMRYANFAQIGEHLEKLMFSFDCRARRL